MLPVFLLGVALTLCTYGVAAFFVTRAMLRNSRRGGKWVALLALYLVVLWPLCLWLGVLIATGVPLQWGHAGEAYYLPYIALTPIIFLLALARGSRELNSLVEEDADSAATKQLRL
jgi:hypothetical protein